METKFVQEFISILDALDVAKVKSMFANYSQIGDGFEDAFQLAQYNLKQENAHFENASFVVQSHLIVEYLETYFAEKYRQPVPKAQAKLQTSSGATTPL
jgi:diadenosine tetraphosphate (Ap4A) HIT family hydrolase